MGVPFKINLNLLNLFREFPNTLTGFSEEFLQAVCGCLADSKKSLGSDVLTNLKDNLHADVDYIILAGHLGLAKIVNVEQFITLLKPDLKVSPLNLEVINKTNIFNKKSIYTAMEGLKETKTKSESKFLEEFTFEILLDEVKEIPTHTKKTLYIPLSLISISLHSHGLIDINFYSYLCHALNKVFSDKQLSLYPWIFPDAKLVPDFSEQGLANIKSYMDLKFSEEEHKQYMEIVTSNMTELGKLRDLLPDLETLVFYSVHFQNREIITSLEKLFIALLGHHHVEVRNRATLFLNILYDNTHWQFRGSFKTKISTVGEPFKIECLVEAEPDDVHFAVLLNAFSFDGNDQEDVLSYHQPKVRPYNAEKHKDDRAMVVTIDLGEFPRAGYYDWKLIKFQRGGKIASVYTGFSNAGSINTSMQKLESLERNDFTHKTKPIQGRYIVHPKDTADLQLHEVFADVPEGYTPDKSKGSFQKIKDSLPGYARAGVNALYVMGALERDYNVQYGPNAKQKTGLLNKRKDANPLAITNRTMPNSMLGGAKDLKELIASAKEKKVKIIFDFVTRVSSAHHHKKYAPYLLHIIDPSGKKLPFYGSDGRSWAYEDTALLNFR